MSKKVKQLSPNTEHKNADEIKDPIIQRQIKCEKLSKKIVNLIETESKDGTFSIFELTEIFAKLIHAYNKRFLMDEYKNLSTAKDNE